MFKTMTAAVIPALFVAGVAIAQAAPSSPPFIAEWDQSGDGQVTLAEIRSRRGDIFAMFDADENGRLEGEELKTMADTATAQRAVRAESRAAMQGMAQGMGQGMGQGQRQGRGPGDGRGQGQGPGKGQGEGQGQGMGGLHAAGQTPTAPIDRDAFLALSQTQFQRMDRNGDEVVTAADFGPNG